MRYLVRHPAEQRVDGLGNQVELSIGANAGLELQADGGYERSWGLLPGSHYRKVRGRGCYHLRVSEHRAWLHWDRWDPRRYPLEHFAETPALWAPTAMLVGTITAAIYINQRGE